MIIKATVACFTTNCCPEKINVDIEKYWKHAYEKVREP